MNTAEYIIKKIEELGVNDIFGLPGDYNFDILNTIEDNSQINWIGCTNELNAGYAADGYARIRGYGALVTTYGVGELSAINAIAGAFAENIPIIHIVGLPKTDDIKNKKLLHHNFQDTNYSAFIDTYRSVTAAATILNRDNAKLEIDRIFKILVRKKQPVYIGLPIDIANLDISDRYVPTDWASDKDVLNTVIEKITEKINNSSNPVILGDVLIKRFNAEIEYREFVSHSNIPATNLLMGVNLLDTNLPNYIGGYYANLRNPIAEKHINDTDCLIAIGTIYSDINSFGHKIPYKINDHIAIYGDYTYIDGTKYENIKMSDVLDGICKTVLPKNLQIDKPNIGYKIKDTENNELTSEYIYPRLQEFFKDNDIIIADTGSIPLGICQSNFPASADIQTQTLWASIGWGTPAAFGASLAKPQARTILITGDGSHQISAMEIGNMLRCGIKPIIIVINNYGYATERILSNNENSKYNNIASINYSKFARAFEGDIWATTSKTEEDFDKALKVTQIMNKMCYIELCTVNNDVPKLAIDYSNDNKSISTKNTNIQKDESLIPQKQELTNSNTTYETIVHKNFGENE